MPETDIDEDDLRDLFFQEHPEIERTGAGQNSYPANTRIAWCDFVEQKVRDKVITEDLARTVTLR